MKCRKKNQGKKKKVCWFLSIKNRVKQQLREPIRINTINKRQGPQSDTPPPPHSCGFSFFKAPTSPGGSDFKRDVKPAATSGSCEVVLCLRK